MRRCFGGHPIPALVPRRLQAQMDRPIRDAAQAEGIHTGARRDASKRTGAVKKKYNQSKAEEKRHFTGMPKGEGKGFRQIVLLTLTEIKENWKAPFLTISKKDQHSWEVR